MCAGRPPLFRVRWEARLCVGAAARPFARFELVSGARFARLGRLAFDCEYEVRVELLPSRPASSQSQSQSSSASSPPAAAALSFTTPACDDARALAALRVLRSASQPSCAQIQSQSQPGIQFRASCWARALSHSRRSPSLPYSKSIAYPVPV